MYRTKKFFFGESSLLRKLVRSVLSGAFYALSCGPTMTLKDAGSNCGLIRPPAARAAAVLPRAHRLEGASNRRHSRIVKAAADNLQPDRQAARTVGTIDRTPNHFRRRSPALQSASVLGLLLRDDRRGRLFRVALGLCYDGFAWLERFAGLAWFCFSKLNLDPIGERHRARVTQLRLVDLIAFLMQDIDHGLPTLLANVLTVAQHLSLADSLGARILNDHSRFTPLASARCLERRKRFLASPR